jgi:hypothetical protein
MIQRHRESAYRTFAPQGWAIRPYLLGGRHLSLEPPATLTLKSTGWSTVYMGKRRRKKNKQPGNQGSQAVHLKAQQHNEKPLPILSGSAQNAKQADMRPTTSAPHNNQLTQQQISARELTEQRFLSEDLEDLTPINTDMQLVADIAAWKREAKFEDNDRYFCHVDEVDQLARGSKCFVIGRKGSGKTAICEYFSGLQKFDKFSEKLTFKNFPFNILYEHTNNQFTPPNQFISIWKYVIYSTICRLMLRNQSVDPTIRAGLSKLYGDSSSLSRRLDRWVQKEFGLSLFGLSSKFAKEHTAPQDSWIDSVNFLEDLVLKYAGDATYFVLFDELDEDYHDILAQEQHAQYIALLTSLFKAVQDVRAICCSGARKLRIYPIIFLRDDIFNLIYDNDKTKWGDFAVDLSCDVRRIKKIIAFRISRALSPNCKEALNFELAWKRAFGTGQVKKRSPLGMSRVRTFDYIARATLLRPRDFVAYLQQCAQLAKDEDTVISAGIVRRADKAFSNYLRGELTDELGSILPDIRNIFDVISQVRKPFFSASDFEKAYEEQVSRGVVAKRNVQSLLQTLFAFSVIGNNSRPGLYVFRYDNRESQFNFNEGIVVHRGLLKSLQVF